MTASIGENPDEKPPEATPVTRARAALDALAEYDESRNDLRLMRALQRIQGDEGEEA